MSHHAEAVLRGRLSQKHQTQICIQQERFRQVLDQVSLSLTSDVGTELTEDKDKRGVWNAFKQLRYNVFRKSRQRHQSNSDDLWRLWYLGVQSMTLSVSVLGTDGGGGGGSSSIGGGVNCAGDKGSGNNSNGNNFGAHSSANTTTSSSAVDTPESARERRQRKTAALTRPPAISLHLAEEDDEGAEREGRKEEEEKEEEEDKLFGNRMVPPGSSTGAPSKREQELVLGGSYGALIGEDGDGALTPTTPTTPTLLMGDGAEGMLQEAARAMADWADAPRQEVEESQL